MLYELLKPGLFRLPAEEAHDRTCALLRLPGASLVLRMIAGAAPTTLATKAFGLDFPNPLGLAAGFDKDARMIKPLSALGFGFIEVGSIPLRPQPGNPKPRMFRLIEQEAIVNRMGFNSFGASAAAKSLSKAPKSVPIGVNLGLNKDCPKDKYAEEYAQAFELLKSFGDYFVVNVSSPNTSGLRDLQETQKLQAILEAIKAKNPAKKPVLVKLAPDLSDVQLDGAITVAERFASGIVATNTTIQRPGIPADLPDLQGGLSGAPLRALSTELIRKIRARTKLPIIGVGGVMTGADALEKIRAGACLVQLYTGLVYRGPAAAVQILRELEALLAARGFASVAEAVGTEEAAA
jgi:dihydroorotate dehydrogenase